MSICQHFVIIFIVMSVRQCTLASIFYSLSFYLKSIDRLFVTSLKFSPRVLFLWVLTPCRIIFSAFLMKVTPVSSGWLIKVQIEAEVIRRRRKWVCYIRSSKRIWPISSTERAAAVRSTHSVALIPDMRASKFTNFTGLLSIKWQIQIILKLIYVFPDDW